MITDSDSRQNRPSASAMYRYDLCPGSWQLELQGHGVEESEDYTERGDRIHAALAKAAQGTDKLWEGLTPDEMQVAQECWEHVRDLVAACLPYEVTEHGDRHTMIENRLWFNSAFSGKPDLVLTSRKQKHALVVDYKSGWQPVQPIAQNLQMRAQAVLVSDMPGISRVTVALVHPGQVPAVTVCEYSDVALRAAKTHILAILQRAEDPGARLNPGETQCQFCPVKASCPALKAQLDSLVPTTAESMSPAVISQVLDRCKLAEEFIGAVRHRAKQLLAENPEAIPGWALKPGAVRHEIVDLKSLWNRCQEIDMHPSVFISCCKVSKAALKEQVGVISGSKGKVLEATFKSLIDGCTEEKQNEPSLVKR